MISTDHVNKTANALLKTFAERRIDVFYIDSSALIVSKKECVQITVSGQPAVSKETPLEIFLLRAKEQQPRPCILLIDARSATLPADMLVAINMCYSDGKRTLCGVDVTDNVLVILLANGFSQDASFLSRQEHLIEWRVPSLKLLSDSTEPVVYDLHGYSDWKKALFGRVILHRNEIQWHPAKFVEMMQQKQPLRIELIHFPEEARAAMCYFIAQSHARGYFDYHGYHVPFDANIDVTCGKNTYDFSTIEVASVVHTDSVHHIESECWLINTHTFDLLLYDKEIEDTMHCEIPGLLQRHANTSLSLYLSSVLTDAQWWCLFQKGAQHRVQLSLHLLPGVELPPDVRVLASSEAASAIEHPSNTAIMITNSPDAVLRNISVEDKPSDIIDVEDFDFQGLGYAVLYQRTATGYDNFTLRISAVLKTLQNGNTVILKGEFSPALLAYFDTWLLPNPYVVIDGAKQYFTGKLCLIVEDPDLSARDESIYQDILKWLTRDGQKIQTRYMPPAPKAPVIRLYDENLVVATDSLDPAEAQNFMQRRKQALFDALSTHAMVQLVGHTGAGKSRLIQELEVEHTDRYAVYRELGNLKQWAADKSDKIKILFIDESNIDDKHYTMFMQLKQGGNRKILVDGELIQLSDQHKIVFARNPHDYGGGRALQKLFVDNTIPELHFADFTPSYIYHAILKPIANCLRMRIDEATLLTDCALYIAAYLSTNKKPDHKDHMTVRELQQKFLSYCVAQLDRTVISRLCQARLFHRKDESPFVITETARLACSPIELFIDIKQYQRRGILPAGIGLNGIYIEGKPGVGKSAMIAHLFQKMNTTDFIKIDASVLLNEKKSMLLRAFRAGKPVWLDEINCCMDDGLEKWLNKVLTGEDPETGLPAQTPGFFVVMSANGAELEGRSPISPALRHRCVNINLQKPTREDVQKILDASHDAPPEAVASLARDFIALQKETSDVTLRSLITQRKACLAVYCDAPTARAIPAPNQ